MTHAPCFGMYRMFESTDLRDHVLAKSICDRCPLIAACETNLAQMIETSGVHGQPEGTWAGRLYIDKRPGDRRNRIERARQDDAMYDDDEARRAHNQYRAGLRDDWTLTGERVFEARRKRDARKKAVA